MEKETRREIMEKTRALMEAPTCSSEAKAAAQRWLDAAGTEAEKEETQRYIKELEGDIMPVDMLIGFAKSEKGAAYFGAEKAAEVAAHGEEIRLRARSTATALPAPLWQRFWIKRKIF